MKYPIGIQNFSEIVDGGYVYLDKTKLLYDLVHNGKIYFLSRPRRFGKSLLISTLECYFQGKKELFKGLAIEQLEKEWKQYPVFHIDFNGKNFTQAGELEKTLQTFVETQELIYGRNPLANTLGDRFMAVLKAAHEKTGLGAVVLIDEYDKPLLDVLDTGLKTFDSEGNERLLEDRHREIMKGFYSVFKAADRDLKFVLLTGVTKFSQVSVFSGFNQPDDISMDDRYEALCGITEEELYSVFDEQIKAMAARYKVSEDEMKYRLKRKYDGYHFSPSMLDIYNPFSILNSLSKKILSDFWFRTGSPTYLVRLLVHFDENLNELTGKFYPTSSFIDYKADTEAPLPMIYQSGYLTIKDWNMDTDSYLLDFPNDEVKAGFVTMVAANYLKPKESPDAWVVEVVNTMKMGDRDKLEKLLTSFFASIPYSQRRKDDEREKERYFQYTFYLVIRMISSFTVLIEKEQSEGRVDCIIETPMFVYIFEFKRDGSATEALKQIEEKGYAREYATDNRTIYLIGCNFSSKTGTIDDWKSKGENLRKLSDFSDK
ncbi:AAA family ATPase [Segatella copri]|uniref:ATP-binding protein n=1 Tax=Segatella copri TaxID=165179 RepID=UPI003F887490